MYKQLLSATAIALAMGLQGCGSVPTFPKADVNGSFANAGKPGAQGIVAEKVSVADAALAAGDAASAIRIYRQLAREYPLSLEPRIKLGSALLDANAPQEAARAYEGANKINPTYDGVAGLGRVYLALHQPAEALKQFDRAARMRPGDAKAMNGQGVALDQLGRHVEAQKIFLAILDKDPSNLKVRSNYALSLAFAGKYDDAADILNSLAQVPDADERIRQNLALVYGLSGNSGQAAHFGRMDLDEDAVNSNLKYYGSIRNLNSPSDKAAAVTRPTATPVQPSIGPFDAAEAKPAPHPVAAKAPAQPAQTASATAGAPVAKAEPQVPQIATRSVEPRITHPADKPVLGAAGIRPVVVARIEPVPAKSSSPAEAKAPSKAELDELLASVNAEIKDTKAPAKRASKPKHTSLADLPMTRAEAAAQAAQASEASGDDVVPVAQKPAAKPEASKPSPAAQPKAEVEPAPLAIAENASLAEDLAPTKIAPPKSEPSRSHGPAVPAVPPAATGVTAAVASSVAVPAVGATTKPVKSVKKRLVQSSSAAFTVDANPVDTGVRAPAVPALL